MKNALSVRVLHGARHLRHQRHAAARFAAQSRCGVEQTPACGKLHAEEGKPVLVLAEFVNRQNIWMIETRRGSRLAAKTRQRFLRIGVVR